MIIINKENKGAYSFDFANCDITVNTKNVMKNSFTFFGNKDTNRFQTVDSWNVIAGDTIRSPRVISP